MIEIKKRRKDIISLTGTPCSGKSTLNELLKKELGYNSESVGSTVKRLALERGLDPETFYERNTVTIDGQQLSLDKYLDDYQTKLGLIQDKFIIDSRLGFYFIPQSFRVSALCKINVAAKRGHRKRREQSNYSTIENAQKTIRQRLRLEKTNFKEKYGIPDYRDSHHFDLVFDNSHITAEKAVELILAKYKEYQARTDEIKIIAKGFDTIDSKHFSYISTPVSEGELLYNYLREKKIHFREEIKKDPAYIEQVIKSNIKNAKDFASRLRTESDGCIIIPANFHRSEWKERDYLDLWIPLLTAKADRIYFINGWQYSGGCIDEFLAAQEKGIYCCDHNKDIITKTSAKELITNAITILTEMKVSNYKLKELCAKIR